MYSNQRQAKLSSLPGRYAFAFYHVLQAEERHTITEQLNIIASCFIASKVFRSFLCNNFISLSALKELLEGLRSVLNLHEKLKNFLFVIHQNKRLKILPDIIDVFNNVYAYDTESYLVEVTLACAENAASKRKIHQAVQKIFGHGIKINYVLDPTLLGGMILKRGHYVIDLSAVTQLQMISKLLRR